MENKTAYTISPTAEEYSKAMNSIGQNLYTSLIQSMEKLPPHFRNPKMISNALAAFCVNVIHKQSSGNEDLNQQLLDELVKLMTTHLNAMKVLQ